MTRNPRTKNLKNIKEKTPALSFCKTGRNKVELQDLIFTEERLVRAKFQRTKKLKETKQTKSNA